MSSESVPNTPSVRLQGGGKDAVRGGKTVDRADKVELPQKPTKTTVPEELKSRFQELAQGQDGKGYRGLQAHSVVSGAAGAQQELAPQNRGATVGDMPLAAALGAAGESLTVGELLGQAAQSGPPRAPAELATSPAAAPQAAAAASQSHYTGSGMADLLERRVRRLLMDSNAGKGEEGGKLMLTLDEGPFAGADIWLEKTSNGWQLDARVTDETKERDFMLATTHLQQRFDEAGLGTISVRLDTHSGAPSPDTASADRKRHQKH